MEQQFTQAPQENATVKQSIIQKCFSVLQGRSTSFFLSFFAAGTVLQFLHRLDGTYITFMGTLLGFVVGHSVKEDIFAQKTTITSGT